jgi:hypothetical protein
MVEPLSRDSILVNFGYLGVVVLLGIFFVSLARLPVILITVEQIRCGLFLIDANSGILTVFETERIPATRGIPFGCVINFSANVNTVAVREELELSKPHASWGTGEQFGTYTISSDQKRAWVDMIADARLGQYTTQWIYATNFESGAHKLQFYMEGKLVHTYVFTILEKRPQKGRFRSTTYSKAPHSRGFSCLFENTPVYCLRALAGQYRI